MQNAAQIAPSMSAVANTIGFDAAAQFETFWREIVDIPGVYRDEHVYRLVTGEQHPLGNFAIVPEDIQSSDLETAAAPLLEIAAPSAVFSLNPAVEPLREQLTALGFSTAESMPAMAVDIDALSPTELPAGYEFERVASGEGSREWTEVLASGYPLPLGLSQLLSPEALQASHDADANLQFFGVRRSGKLVATSMLYLADGLAGIYCVSTMPEERGKGLGAHVTAEPLRVASEIGYKVGILQSSEDGHPVYVNLGFRDVGAIYAYMRLG